MVWAELGITWRVRWMNVETTSRAVEQFVAVLQIALTDFAQHDLYLLKTDVDIEAAVGDVTQPVVTPLPSNEGRRWRIILPNSSAGDVESMSDRTLSVFGAASAILREASLLSDEQYFAALESVVRDGILSKLLIARSYERLAAEFANDIDETLPGLIVRPLGVEQRKVVAASHPELAWIDRPIPGYSRGEAAELAASRYAHAKETLPLTLRQLREQEEFRMVAETLRRDGWRDWHILLALANQTWNYRTAHTIGPLGLLDPDNDAWRQYAFKPEGADSPVVPLDEYTEDKLRTALRMTMISTLENLGLECRQMTPDLPAIEEFLARRCNYWVDDCEHEDLLGLGSAQP